MMFSELRDSCALALFRPSIMIVLLDIIMENVPELTALDLSDNNLSVLDSLIVLALKVPNLRVLHIGRNPVSYCVQSAFFSLLHDCLIQILAVTLTTLIEVVHVFLSYSKYLNISHEYFLPHSFRFIIHYLVIQNDRLSC
jgi:hypothetical protein